MCVPSTIATFPNIWNNHIEPTHSAAVLKRDIVSHLVTNLHANHGVDEEQHGDQQSDIRQSLQAIESRELDECDSISLKPVICGSPHLEGFNERPKQGTDALPPAEQLDQTHYSKQTEESDGNASAVLRVLWRKQMEVRGWQGGMSGPRWHRASGCALQADGVQTETLETTHVWAERAVRENL